MYLNNKISNKNKLLLYIKENNISEKDALCTDSKKILNNEKLLKCKKHIIVPDLFTIGNTSYQILKFIDKIFNNGSSLHIANYSIVLDSSDFLCKNFTKALLNIEKEYIRNRIRISKETRKKDSSSLRGKKRKKRKSKFDKYKSKIMRLHYKGNSIKKISDEINLGTPQALGRYIKKNVKVENEVHDNLSNFFKKII